MKKTQSGKKITCDTLTKEWYGQNQHLILGYKTQKEDSHSKNELGRKASRKRFHQL